jgi:hypothetical protein
MWKIGDRVLGKRLDENYWYPGTVRHTDGSRFYVIFDDGEDALAADDQLKPLTLRPGDRAFVRFGEDRTYVPGTVTAREGDNVCVRLEGGREDWVGLAQLRFQPGARPAAPPPPSTSPALRREVGERVLACWHDLCWYPGLILNVSGEQCLIVFDDGNQGLIAADKVRPLTVGEGDRVWCRWKGGPTYYPGEITDLKGEVVHIKYDDGDEETTLLRLVRLERDDWFPMGALAEFGEGERVLACWYDLNWYPGVIVSITGKRVHILFDDGDQAMVTPDRIKALAFKLGDRLCCRRKGGPIYYPGEITRISGEVIQISYDDGEEETTSIRFIRIEREGLRDQPAEGFE